VAESPKPSPAPSLGSAEPSAPARHAGPIALAAGVFFALTDLGRFPLVDDRLVLATDPVVLTVNAAFFFAFVGLLVALVALHERLGRACGRFGLVAFLVALLGTMTQGGNMWFDAFAAPWLAEVLPQAFVVPKTPILLVGGLLSYVLLAVGWALQGLAWLRARVVPVAASVAVVAGGLLAYNSGMPPYGTPLGLAVAALGGWLIVHDRRTAGAQPHDSRARTQDSRTPAHDSRTPAQDSRTPAHDSRTPAQDSRT
jgi:hypothetical protein